MLAVSHSGARTGKFHRLSTKILLSFGITLKTLPRIDTEIHRERYLFISFLGPHSSLRTHEHTIKRHLNFSREHVVDRTQIIVIKEHPSRMYISIHVSRKNSFDVSIFRIYFSFIVPVNCRYSRYPSSKSSVNLDMIHCVHWFEARLFMFY